MIFEPLVDQIRRASKIVFVTGAGISQESGIPTFRDKGGHWRDHDSAKLATIEAFYENPGLVWEWYDARRKNILAAQPNPGHKAIAELEEFVDVVVLTQNVDGLHKRAGSSNVLELHGSIIKIKCTVCDFSENIEHDFDSLPPLCRCGNMLRPDVVWFGESLHQDVWSNAINHAKDVKLMIVVGTSLAVSPANMLPMYAKQNEAVLIEINIEKTVMSDKMDLSIQDTSSSVALPELLKIFKN